MKKPLSGLAILNEGVGSCTPGDIQDTQPAQYYYMCANLYCSITLHVCQLVLLNISTCVPTCTAQYHYMCASLYCMLKTPLWPSLEGERESVHLTELHNMQPAQYHYMGYNLYFMLQPLLCPSQVIASMQLLIIKASGLHLRYLVLV
jgi:hypothetical protein